MAKRSILSLHKPNTDLSRNAFDRSAHRVFSAKLGQIIPFKFLSTVGNSTHQIQGENFLRTIAPQTDPFVSLSQEIESYFVPYSQIYSRFNEMMTTRADAHQSSSPRPSYSRTSFPAPVCVPTIMPAKIVETCLRGFAKSLLLYTSPRLILFDRYFVDFQYMDAYYNTDLTTWFNANKNFLSLVRVDGKTFSEGWTVGSILHMNNIFTLLSVYGISSLIDNSPNVDSDDFSVTPWANGFDIVKSQRYEPMECIQMIDYFGFGNLVPQFTLLYQFISKVCEFLSKFADETEMVSNVQHLSLEFTSSELMELFSAFQPNYSSSNESQFAKAPSVFVFLENQVMGSPVPAQPLYPLVVNSSSFLCSVITYHSFAQTNLWKVAAYNKIWNEFHRSAFWDYDDVNPRTFNFDDYPCTGLNNDHLVSFMWVNNTSSTGYASQHRQLDEMYDMFSFKFRRYKSDFITGLVPDNQFGAVSSLPTMSDASMYVDNGIQGRALNVGTANAVSVSDTGHGVVRRASLSSSDVSANLNVFDIVKANALQKFRQKLMQSGYRVESAMQGIYGVKPHYIADDAPYLIDASNSTVRFDEVVQTAQLSQNSRLGEIAGKGVSTIQYNGKFTSNDFGIIVETFSVIPNVDYPSTMLDLDNVMFKQEDYFVPEFQNLGLQPISLKHVDTVTNTYANSIVGFAPAYAAYKTDLDKCYGLFANISRLESYVNSYDWTVGQLIGAYSAWVLQRDARFMLDTYDIVDKLYHSGWLYVSPFLLDNVFGIKSDASPLTDTFLVTLYSYDKSVQPISVSGFASF